MKMKMKMKRATNTHTHHSPTSPGTASPHNNANSNNNPNPTTASTSQPPLNNPAKKRKKLHILGPSVFNKHLYDIPEYQPTTDNASDAGSNDKNKTNGNYGAFKTDSRLTKQALQQFNGNFSNYWNQRASFRQYGSSNGDHGDDEAGSIHTNESHPTTTTKPLTDDGSSTVPQHTEEHHPLMTSSQIIHPTQAKPPNMAKMKRSRSFPLLHSAENIANFKEYSRDFMTPNQHHKREREGGSACSIPSPPPISTTPDLNGMTTTNSSVMFTCNLKNVHPLKSWESVHSSNVASVHSFGEEEHAETDSCADDAVLVTTQTKQPPLVATTSDHRFIRDKQKSSMRQKQWLRRSLSEMKQASPLRGNDSKDESTGIVHVDHAASHKSTASITATTTPSEIDWTVTESTIGQVIACPIPKSIRKNKRKKAKKKQSKQEALGNEKEEDQSFSDWSNVSSNVGVNVASPTTLQK